MELFVVVDLHTTKHMSLCSYFVPNLLCVVLFSTSDSMSPDLH